MYKRKNLNSLLVITSVLAIMFLFSSLALAANNTLFSDDFESQTLNAWNQTYSTGWGILSHNGSYVANQSVSSERPLIIDNSNVTQFNLTGKFAMNSSSAGTSHELLIYIRANGYSAGALPAKYVRLGYSLPGVNLSPYWGFYCFYNNGSGQTACATNPLAQTVDTNFQDFNVIADNDYYEFRVNGTKIWNATITGMGYTNSTASFATWSNWPYSRLDNITLYGFGIPGIQSWSNNFTNNASLNFSALVNNPINFTVTLDVNTNMDYINWSIQYNTTTSWTNGTSTNNFITYNFPNNSEIIYINASAHNLTGNSFSNVSWNVTAYTYNLQLLSPANTSSSISTTTSLVWRQWMLNTPYTYQIATDPQFIGIVASGLGVTHSNETITAAVSLTTNTEYFWRVKNNTGSYSNWYSFNTTGGTIVSGRINATVFDEQNWSIRITNFTAQLYNSTTMIVKNTTTGWANFSSDEVSSGQYLLRIVPNSSYASRSVIVTSPANVSVYIPLTINTINTIAFYLMDYTTLYPWSSSILSVTKNGSTMHSSYFDADAKVAVYLIQGDSYGISITNGNNIHNWGNYISVASGNVEIVITNIAVNVSATQPFTYNLSKSSNDITLSWTSNHILNNLNFTILKNNTELVHQLITTIGTGQSTYSITDLNSTYYIYLEVNGSYYLMWDMYNPQVGQLRTNCGLGLGCIIGWGSGSTRYSLPQWMYNSSSVFIIWIIAGSFGAAFASFGIILAFIMTLLFTFFGWLNMGDAGASFLGALTIIAIVNHLKSRI